MSTRKTIKTARKNTSTRRTVAKKAPKKPVVVEPQPEENEENEENEETEEIIVDTVDVTEGDAEDAEDAEAAKKIEQRIDDQIQELKDYKAMVRGMCNAFIDNLQDAKREIRQLRRTQKKPRQISSKAPKKKSTFEIPIPLSEELCDFLGKPHGTKMSRNAVTHNIQKYCNSNGLMEGRVIKPDRKMKKILMGVSKNKEFKLTWLNLQTYIKHNYQS